MDLIPAMYSESRSSQAKSDSSWSFAIILQCNNMASASNQGSTQQHVEDKHRCRRKGWRVVYDGRGRQKIVDFAARDRTYATIRL